MGALVVFGGFLVVGFFGVCVFVMFFVCFCFIVIFIFLYLFFSGLIFLYILILHSRKEMFYLTMHSTHFIYGYMASDIWLRTIPIVRMEREREKCFI